MSVTKPPNALVSVDAAGLVVVREQGKLPSRCIGCGKKSQRVARKIRLALFLPELPDANPRHPLLGGPHPVFGPSQPWKQTHLQLWYSMCDSCAHHRSQIEQIRTLTKIGLTAAAICIVALFLNRAPVVGLVGVGLWVLGLIVLKRWDGRHPLPCVARIEPGRVWLKNVHAEVLKRIDVAQLRTTEDPN